MTIEKKNFLQRIQIYTDSITNLANAILYQGNLEIYLQQNMAKLMVSTVFTAPQPVKSVCFALLMTGGYPLGWWRVFYGQICSAPPGVVQNWTELEFQRKDLCRVS